MQKRLLWSLIFMSFALCSIGQVTIYKTFEDFENKHLVELSNDTTYVINFWATWCAPCVKELPYFEELNAMYEDQAFKQILVTLDDPKKLDKKVIPFLVKNNIQSQVVLLADGKPNRWIDKVDPSWSGAIPITIICRGNERLFYEQEFHNVEELEEEMLLLFEK